MGGEGGCSVNPFVCDAESTRYDWEHAPILAFADTMGRLSEPFAREVTGDDHAFLSGDLAVNVPHRLAR